MAGLDSIVSKFNAILLRAYFEASSGGKGGNGGGCDGNDCWNGGENFDKPGVVYGKLEGNGKGKGGGEEEIKDKFWFWLLLLLLLSFSFWFVGSANNSYLFVCSKTK